jgi:oligopeptidase A
VTNPLLTAPLPFPFHLLEGSDVVPGIRSALEQAQAELEAIAGQAGDLTYESTLGRLDTLSERLSRAIGPVQHLLAVAETPELRDAYNQVLPEISAFRARFYLHEGLWETLLRFAESPAAAELEGIRKRDLELTLLEFRRAGADLPPEEKTRLEALQVELAGKEQRFSENVLDATNAYSLHVTDSRRLKGIPEAPLRRFRRKAEDEGKEGWLLTLDFPAFEAVMKHARDRDLREEIHRAYIYRCREGNYDNTGLVVEILKLRQEIARLLGHAGFPDFRLEDHMAATGERARAFVSDLTERTRPYWHRDMEELEAHARERGIPELEPWDMSFIQEDLRKARFDIDDEQLRPYFPLQQVEAGLFELVRRVLGLTVIEKSPTGVWDPEVRVFDILDSDGTHLATFYADWFPRPEKRQGAWMNPLATGGPQEDGSFEPHWGFIGGNFTPTDGDRPALLTHREVQTLFHEFGHLLHHATSRSPVRGRGGLNVPWDFVEVPSQLMENWTWERDALDLFARHFETGKPLPDELFQRMIAARRFMGGRHQMRQLSFGTMDLALHSDFDPEGEEDVIPWVERVLEPFGPRPSFAQRNILTVFSHLFSGGYASAYYSYLWSEVLEADAFSRFRDEGVFNQATGRAFLETILSRGNSADPADLFREFMGRDPDPEALVERNLGPQP